MSAILGNGNGWDGNDGSTGAGTGSGQGNNPVTWVDPNAAETGTLQVLLGEGRVEGLVDGLKSVYLDNTPIQNSDGTFNFKGVTLALVAGTNTQAAVRGITSTEAETAVNVQVTNSTPVTRTITSNPSAVRVRIAIPSLKVISITDGSTSGFSARVRIERQNPAWNGGAWEIITLESGGYILGGPFSTKFTKSYRVELPISGSWQIRVSRISADDASVYEQSQTWWEAFSEIKDASFRYPNSSVLSLRVNSKQFRSIPKVTCDMKLSRVLVPSNYDPATRTYYTTGFGTTAGAWDGTFGDRATSTVGKEVWTDNPAWCFYDAATKTRYGTGTFLSASALDKWALYTIAQWCDTLVADGKGGTEPRMTCNLYIQGAQSAIKGLGQLASIFWGVLYYAGGVIVPVADTDASPVHLFTNANVKEGRFNYSGTAKTARHTAALVSFTNPDLGWQQDVAVYEDTAGIARFGYNALDLQGIGCTSQGQALRWGKWSILSELMSSEVVTFTSGMEGSTVKPGDVIQVADQFRAGASRFGGRLLAGSTTTQVSLDAPVTLGAGTYTLRIKNSSGVVESRTVSTGAGTWQALTVASAFSEAPGAGQGWLLQEGTTASLWRVMSVRKADGMEHEVAALYHDPAKYTALGLTAGDVVTRPTTASVATAPLGLAASATSRILNDRQVLTINAAWTLDSAAGYVAQASRDNGPWEPMTVSGASALLDNVQPGSWRVRVAGDWKTLGMSPYAETTVTVSSSSTLPGFVDSVAQGNIQSTNYVAGSAGNAPVGFKMAATPFTSTLFDGSTFSASMELAAAANFGGYRVGDVNTRAITSFNRIANPSGSNTYSGTLGWATSESHTGTVAPTYGTSTNGFFARAVSTAGNTTGTVTAQFIQGFVVPPTATGQTVNLTCDTAYICALAASPASGDGSVNAYIVDCATGTETLLATWSYSNSAVDVLTPSYTARSVNITSYVSGGGSYLVRFEVTARGGTAGVAGSWSTIFRNVNITI